MFIPITREREGWGEREGGRREGEREGEGDGMDQIIKLIGVR